MPEQLPRLERCLNCGSLVSRNFCAECGQENEDQRVALRYLISDVLAEIAAIDSKLFRTVVPLLFRPGFVTKDYNSGKRVRYLSPLKMYLVASLAFFLCASLMTPPIRAKIPVVPVVPPEADAELGKALKAIPPDALTASQMAKLRSALGHSGAGVKTADGPPKTLESYAKPKLASSDVKSNKSAEGSGANPISVHVVSGPWSRSSGVSSSVNRWAKQHAERLKNDPRALIVKALDMAPKVMFVVLPLFALLLKMLYGRSKRLYVEHLIFGLHYHAFVFAALALAMVVRNQWFAGAIFTYIPIYLLVAMRKVYDQGYMKTFLKFLLLTTCYNVLLVLGVAAVFAIAFASI